MEENLKRRGWFRFNLRMLFVMVSLVCIYLGWAMNWKRQRQQFLLRADVENCSNNYQSTDRASAPLALRMLGESGITCLTLGDELRQVHPDMERAARHLFPESYIDVKGYKLREWPTATPKLPPWDPSE